jgi:hypothetical protein
MKAITKITTGAAAALATLTAAAPAEARTHRHDSGIDAGDVIAGVAIVGGIAAIASAIGNDQDRYGYGDRYGYDNRYGSRYGAGGAIEACTYQAQRYGGGRVRVTDVDRRGNRSYRVRGVIENGRGGWDRGGYDRYDRYGGRIAFKCTARDNGRVTGFKLDRRGY